MNKEKSLSEMRSFKLRTLAAALTNALCICESIQNGEVENSLEIEKSMQNTVEVLCAQILEAVTREKA